MRVKQGSFIAKIMQAIIIRFVKSVYGNVQTIYGDNVKQIYACKSMDDKVMAIVFLNETEYPKLKSNNNKLVIELW